MLAGLLLNIPLPGLAKRTLRRLYILLDGRIFLTHDAAIAAARELAWEMALLEPGLDQVAEAALSAKEREKLEPIARHIGDLLGKVERQGPEALIHQVASRDAAVGQFTASELKMLARVIEREYDEDDVVVLLTIP